jgi:hypothetical protein
MFRLPDFLTGDMMVLNKVVRFFHKQGYALRTPQPWPDKQDEQLREAFLQKPEQLLNRPDNEEKLLERLHQAILDVIDNPEKIQQTTAIGTLF